MAIQDEETGAQNNGQQSAPGNMGTQNPYTSTTDQARATHLGDVNSLLARGGKADNTEGRSGELLTALTLNGKEAVAAQNLTPDYELVRFDRDQHRVGVGAILVLRAFRKGADTYIAVRPLLVDNKQVSLKPRILNIGQERLEIPTYVADVLSDEYWNRIVRHVQEHVANPKAVVANAGYLEVPADFDVSDKNNADVSKLLSVSVNRCDDVLARVNGETPFNISSFKAANEVLTAKLDFSGTPRTDLFGQPIRSDIQVSMNRSIRGNAEADPFYDADTQFSSVSCYVNLEYAPAATPQGYAPAAVMETQLFTPTIVITDVRQASWIGANTPELYFLALSNAYRTTAGTAWAGSLLPDVAKKDDPRDIGALTFLTKDAKKTKTKTDTFTPAHFGELMFMLVRPNPTFLIDINPVGENSAIENVLLMAASDGPNRERAVQMLVGALNNLTSGHFSQIFDHTKHHLIRMYGTDVHRGYYLDAREDRHDLRDLGTLEALNASGGNIQEFIAYYRTMCDQAIHPEIRLKQRVGYERQYLSQNLVIRGKYHRLVWTPEFILALDNAVKAAGVSVDVENVSTVYGSQRFTGNTAVTQFAVAQQAQYGMGNNAGQGGYGLPGGAGAGTMIY
ncbi:hypothetical protein D3C87_1199480 [compost metagenome]